MNGQTTKISAVKPAGLVDHWREVWKQWSTWALGLLIAAPDAIGAVVAQGWLSQESAHWGVRGLAIAGILVKFVSQRKS